MQYAIIIILLNIFWWLLALVYRFACLHEIEMSLFLSFKFYFTFLSKAMSLLKLTLRFMTIKWSILCRCIFLIVILFLSLGQKKFSVVIPAVSIFIKISKTLWKNYHNSENFLRLRSLKEIFDESCCNFIYFSKTELYLQAWKFVQFIMRQLSKTACKSILAWA